MGIDPDALASSLRERFDGTESGARVVARQAVDLSDSGRYETDTGFELTERVVLEELADAPDESIPDRWNWWMGSLEIAYGGYEEFGVRRFRR